jgi:hypothetical protein
MSSIFLVTKNWSRKSVEKANVSYEANKRHIYCAIENTFCHNLLKIICIYKRQILFLICFVLYCILHTAVKTNPALQNRQN